MKFMADKAFMFIVQPPPPPHSLDLAPADFFLFLTIKKQLAGKTMTQESFKSMWEGAARTVTEEGLASAFQQWHECCK
jgi:hypothetical protein